MKSDIVYIDNTGNGFQRATDQAKKVAVYKRLGELETIQLQVLTEEMMSLVRSITGEVKASFWIEFDTVQANLHMTTKAVLDSEKRAELIASSTSRKNEAAKTFLGRVREMFETAMASDPSVQDYELPVELQADLAGHEIDAPQEWDRYEQSVLFRLADNVSIAIRGGRVNMTVTKYFKP